MTSWGDHSPHGLRDGVASPRPATYSPWIAATIALLAYGSLLPFRFDATRAAGYWKARECPLTLHVPTMEDLVVNVLVYVPLGALLALRATRRSPESSRAWWVWIVPFGGIVSLALETLQALVPARVPSWTDVAMNAWGSGCGAALILVWRRHQHVMAGYLRRLSVRRPFQGLAAALTVGLFVWSLAPFDWVFSTTDLVASFLHAEWSLRATNDATYPESLAASIRELDGLLWFAVLGYLSAMAARERGAGSLLAGCWAFQHGLILAVLIELLQLFTRSHVFEPLIVLPRTIAAGVGAACAAALAFRDAAGESRRSGPRVPAGLLVLVLLYQPFRLMVLALSPDLSTTRGECSWSVLPFLAAWAAPAVPSALQVVGTLLAYATFALVLGWTLERAGARCPRLKCTAVVTLFAVYTEFLQVYVPGRTPDVTVAILALAAGLVAAWTARCLERMIAAAPAEATAVNSR